MVGLRQTEQPILLENVGADQMRPAWEQLASDCAVDDVAAHPVGLAAWTALEREGKALPLLMLQAGDRPLAWLPIAPSHRVVCGVRFRVLQTPEMPPWRSVYPLVAPPMDRSMRRLLGSLFDRPGWDVLDLGPMLRDCPLTDAVLRQGKELAMGPRIQGHLDDAVVMLNGSWEAYYASRSSRLRSEVRKGEQQMLGQGELRLEEYRGGPELPARLEEFYRIEASGWKGREGTAIRSDPQVEWLYSQLAYAAADQGMLRLYRLFCGSCCVAAQYCVADRGSIYSIKAGYEDAWAPCSPGHVMHRYLLAYLFADPQALMFDLMVVGDAHGEHKHRWANHVRDYVCVRLFNPRSLRGRLAQHLSGWRDRWRQRRPVTRAVGYAEAR